MGERSLILLIVMTDECKLMEVSRFMETDECNVTEVSCSARIHACKTHFIRILILWVQSPESVAFSR